MFSTGFSACFHNLGALFVGALLIRALLLVGYLKVPDFCKLTSLNSLKGPQTIIEAAISESISISTSIPIPIPISPLKEPDDR